VLDLIDGEPVVFHHHALGVVRPAEAVDPLTMSACPIPTAIVQPAAQEELAQPVATPLQIGAGVVARPPQIADRLLLGVGGRTSVNNPARSNSASLRASRRLVFTRSPGLRGTSAGAITWQPTRVVVI
jgi:hypothetical protein